MRYATLRDLGIDRVYDHYYVCIQLQLANTTSKQYISSYIKNFPVVVALLQKEKSDSGCDTQVDRFTSQHHSRTTSDGRSGGGGRRRRRR